MYLLARPAREPGKPFREPDFDPLLAVHRMQKVEMTDRQFEMPANLDFDKLYNQHFGVMKDEAFQVEVEFTGWSARYVAERVWSPDQKILRIGRDKIRSDLLLLPRSRRLSPGYFPSGKRLLSSGRNDLRSS